jgi:hypothetical protein
MSLPADPFADRTSRDDDEYSENPFADANDKYLEPDESLTPHASTVDLPYHQRAGGNGLVASGSSASRMGGDETAARLDEIRRREMELEQRERNLGQRENHIRLHGRSNWPPKPFWPFAPLIFHDIEQEIPQESRVIVLTLYRLWLAFLVTAILNFVACILLLVSGADDGAKDLGGSIVDLFIVPVAFLLWYRSVVAARCSSPPLC